MDEGESEGLEFGKYVDEFTVRDGNIVTGKGEGFTEFALKVEETFGIMDENSRTEFTNIFRHG